MAAASVTPLAAQPRESPLGSGVAVPACGRALGKARLGVKSLEGGEGGFSRESCRGAVFVESGRALEQAVQRV